METRSKTKEQEVEAILATLITMMKTAQEQQARQERLAEDHLEKVVGAQQEQVERQEEFVRQQNLKWQQLMESHERRCQEIQHKQSEAETTMQALRHDFTSIKDTLHSRFSSTESELEGLQSSQERLTTELHTIKDAVLHKLMGELEAKFATKSQLESVMSKAKTLRPSAPEFVPSYSRSTGSHEMPAAGGTVGTLQKPPPFDEHSSWDAYKLQFEMLANINHWSDVEKATYLAICLRGSALTVLTNISPDHRGEYNVLVAALDKRFGSAHQTELNRVMLKARIRKRDESLPELAKDVEHLCRLAYPDASAPMLEVLAKDQFIDALTDEDSRLRLRQNKPASSETSVGT